MTNFPFEHPVSVATLDRAGVEELLRNFEDIWAETEGERITSAQFYDRYVVGELDSLFAMAWSSYYEAFRRLGHDEVSANAVRELVTG